jgi:hypothetical protein
LGAIPATGSPSIFGLRSAALTPDGDTGVFSSQALMRQQELSAVILIALF